MVLLTATPQIISLISHLPPSATESLDLPPTPSFPIDHQTLIALSHLARAHLPSPPTLNTLLLGTRLYTPPPAPKPVPSPEYLALKASLLAQQEQREYNALLRQRQKVEEDGEDAGEDNIPVSLPFNILLSVILCGGAVFYMTMYWNNAGLRVLLSLGTGIVVGVAEVVVYAGYLRKVKESRRAERKKKERKEIMVVEEDDAVARADVSRSGTKENETVWARGVNGGVRRRVREKWEKNQISNTGSEEAKDK